MTATAAAASPVPRVRAKMPETPLITELREERARLQDQRDLVQTELWDLKDEYDALVSQIEEVSDKLKSEIYRALMEDD
jgi:uncharacterized protein involved in exopolysaccharide biosynthesis